MNRFKEAVALLIANDGPLQAQWLDHALSGDWKDHRACHVGGDFLLIYRRAEVSKHEIEVFVRSGTHSELFR